MQIIHKIDDFLFSEFKELQPLQLISLYSIINEGIQAVTEKKIVALSPPDVLSRSKILNLVSALQFRDLFGIDLTGSFKANRLEMNRAEFRLTHSCLLLC